MSSDDRIEPRTAAVVLNDMINSGLRKRDDDAHNRKIEESGLIANVVRLVAVARTRGIPVIWIRVGRRPDRADVVDNLVDVAGAWHHPNRPVVAGSYEAANVDELPVQPEDQVVLKPRLDPFIGTDLDLQLRARHVETILLGGYSTNIGVESCARTAHDLGYNVVTVSDCCWNVAADLHEFAVQRILPRFSRVMTADAALALLGPRTS